MHDSDIAAQSPGTNASPSPRIGVLVVAYNAESTLEWVLSRIPVELRASLDVILVLDDHSADRTYEVGLAQLDRFPDLPLVVQRHERNLGYGGNQKAGYRWMIDHDVDIVVLLHGDGQYAPEEIGRMIEPIARGDADLVMGSRMMHRGQARAGGMPMYKLVGNKVLTFVQNRLAGVRFSEWHSGYRAFRVTALADVPFESNSDAFDFDTQIILDFISAGHRIVEVPIPTFYGDEISYVNGLVYGKDILRHTFRHWRRQRSRHRGRDSSDDTATSTPPSVTVGTSAHEA
jgi:glycosyltransferase involved in cell wall biosynthesis